MSIELTVKNELWSNDSINIKIQSNYNNKLNNCIRNIISSKFITNWKKEIYDNNLIDDHIYRSLYPRFRSIILFLLNDKTFYISCIFNIWNVISNIVNLVYCLDYLKQYSLGLSLTTLIVPSLLLVIHFYFLLAWNDQSYLTNFITNNKQISWKNTLCRMINYLNEMMDGTEVETTNSLFHKESKVFYQFFTYATTLLIAILNISAAVVDVNNPNINSNKCFIFFAETQGFYVAALTSICISGHATFYLLNSLYKTSWIFHNVILSWINRYLPLQRLKKKDLEYYLYELESDIPNNLRGSIYSAMIRRDAYERYLMIDHSLQEINDQLSTTITLISTISFLVFMFYMYYIFTVSWQYSQSVIVWIVFALILFFFPMGCVAYTNTSIDKVRRIIQYSLPSSNTNSDIDIKDWINNHNDNDKHIDIRNVLTSCDFELIGGRDEWIDYINNNPLYWRVMGIAVTPALLQSLIAGALTTIVISAIPDFLSIIN